jgi:phage shock protein C
MSEQPVTIIEGNARELPAKRWYRSTTDRNIAGVCGGLGEYLGIDTGLVRMFWLLSAFFTAGMTGLLYILLAVVIPEESPEHASQKQVRQSNLWAKIKGNRGLLWGGLLILAGLVLMLNNFGWLPIRLEQVWNAFWALFWPLLLIGLGIFLLLSLNGRAPDWHRLREAVSGFPLRRSRDDRVVAGVCGGLANYLNIDSVIVRIAWVLLSAATVGILGLLLYVLAALIIPMEE